MFFRSVQYFGVQNEHTNLETISSTYKYGSISTNGLYVVW